MEAEILRLYNLGVELKNIAILTNTAYGTVTRLIYKKHELCKRRKSFTRDEVGKVRELYKTKTRVAIAEELSITEYRVVSILSAYGIKKERRNRDW